MSEKKTEQQQAPVQDPSPVEEAPQEAPETEAAPEPDPLMEELEALKTELDEKESKYLRLAAEYDNFRKRSQKEKESIYADAKSDAVLAFLPVYDNLDRALKQVLTKLGIEEIPALGQPFDPALHNAVMHVEDESAGENTVVEVFQTGFKLGEKVIRFAMVKVAN